MKVTCQSCGAHYQLPDDKVRGRKAKVRCKKCSQAILVDGTALTEPQAPTSDPAPAAEAAPTAEAASTAEATPASEPTSAAEATPASEPTSAAEAAPASEATSAAEAAPASTPGPSFRASSATATPTTSPPVAKTPHHAATASSAAGDPAPLSQPHVDPAARWDDDDEATRVMLLRDDAPDSRGSEAASSHPVPGHDPDLTVPANASSPPIPADEQAASPPPVAASSAARATPPAPSALRRTHPPPAPSTSRASRPPTSPLPAATLLEGGGSAQAARRADTSRPDLFAPSADAGTTNDQTTPPNSENSVLFSLEALKAAASSPAPPEKRPTPPPDDFLALGGGADLDAAAMPLIQIEPTQATEDAPGQRRSLARQRGLWVALGGIVAVGVGSYFGVQAYLARADTSIGTSQAQVRARLSEATMAAPAAAAPQAGTPTEPEAQGRSNPMDEPEAATDLSELPKVRDVRPASPKRSAPPVERAPSAGRTPADKEAASPAETPSPARRSPPTQGVNEDKAAAAGAATPKPAEAEAPDEDRATPSTEPAAGEAATGEVAGATAASATGAVSTTAAAPTTAETELATAPAFSVDAARSALASAAASAKRCKTADGPTGTGRVLITFALSGRVTSARVEGSPFAGTTVGGCVARAFRSATVPPFSGTPQTVAKSFTIK